MAAVLPRVELQWVPCGHLAPITVAIRVNPLIEVFLCRVEAAKVALNRAQPGNQLQLDRGVTRASSSTCYFVERE
jgi:hypothetical protein